MKKPVSSDIVTAEIFQSVDLISQLGDLRIKQLINLLEESADEIIVEGVLAVFQNSSRQDSIYVDQKYACRILKELNPSSHLPISRLLEVVCQKWNVSVFELPTWIKNQYESEAIKIAIDLLIQDTPNQREQHQINTFLLYLNSDIS